MKDYFLTNEAFHLVKNPEFGYLETEPKPLENLSKYYESDDYISHSDSNQSLFEKIYQFIKIYNLKYKFNLISNKNSNLKLLDFGCGAGDFLAYAKSKNANVFGIEPNQKAREITAQKIGVENVSDKNLEEINQEFDVISLWHVLEHIPNLHEFLETLKSKLKEDGQLLIAVPNYDSLDAKFYKQYWAAYDVPRHLWHFSPKNIEQLFLHYGMNIEKRFPLWFDSYYVSILSEKYKNSKFGILRAFFIGSLSNLIGIFTGNYSSIIYRIKKNENKSE